MYTGMRRVAKRVLLGVVAVLAPLLGLELIARYGLPFGMLAPGLGQPPAVVEALQAYVQDGLRTNIEASAFRGYLMTPSPGGINEWGFGGPEWGSGPSTDERRIACLGASTTARSAQGSYPAELEGILRGGGARVEVMNFGVPGWTSAESVVNYALLVQDFAPDVVVIHHGINDVIPRLWPGFRADYEHYRVPWTHPRVSWFSRRLIPLSFAYAALQVRSVSRDFSAFTTREIAASERDLSLPAETTAPFVRNVRSIGTLARAHGAAVVIVTLPRYPTGAGAESSDFLIRGLDQHNVVLRTLAAEESWTLVDLAAEWSGRPEEVRPFFLDHVHLTAAGQTRKARDIAAALQQLGLDRDVGALGR